MYGSGQGWETLFIVFCVVCAFVGWGVIELLIWFFSHISFNF